MYHNSVFRADPLARKPLILKRRDAGAVDQARLESAAGEERRAIPTHVTAYSLNELASKKDRSVCVGKSLCASRY